MLREAELFQDGVHVASVVVLEVATTPESQRDPTSARHLVQVDMVHAEWTVEEDSVVEVEASVAAVVEVATAAVVAAVLATATVAHRTALHLDLAEATEVVDASMIVVLAATPISSHCHHAEATAIATAIVTATETVTTTAAPSAHATVAAMATTRASVVATEHALQHDEYNGKASPIKNLKRWVSILISAAHRSNSLADTPGFQMKHTLDTNTAHKSAEARRDMQDRR